MAVTLAFIVACLVLSYLLRAGICERASCRHSNGERTDKLWHFLGVAGMVSCVAGASGALFLLAVMISPFGTSVLEHPENYTPSEVHESSCIYYCDTFVLSERNLETPGDIDESLDYEVPVTSSSCKVVRYDPESDPHDAPVRCSVYREYDPLTRMSVTACYIEIPDSMPISYIKGV